MATDMLAETRRLEPLVANAIAEAARVKKELAATIKAKNPAWNAARVQLKVWAAFALEHTDLAHAEMIAAGRARGATEAQVAQELALVEAQGMW